ncbi:hypothetical protein FRB99_007984 [Tulasnella sp. 403]|nr:hypothetical protein FRB99_007984 [Tulasnella sp. 403]
MLTRGDEDDDHSSSTTSHGPEEDVRGDLGVASALLVPSFSNDVPNTPISAPASNNTSRVNLSARPTAALGLALSIPPPREYASSTIVDLTSESRLNNDESQSAQQQHPGGILISPSTLNSLHGLDLHSPRAKGHSISSIHDSVTDSPSTLTRSRTLPRMKSWSRPRANSGMDHDGASKDEVVNEKVDIFQGEPTPLDAEKRIGLARWIVSVLVKSVAILSHLPYPSLFTAAIAKLGAFYFSHGIAMLEAACHNIANWPDPIPGAAVELGFLGSVMQVEIPRSENEHQSFATSSFGEKFNMKIHMLASLPTPLPSPISLFGLFLDKIWALWECLVLSEPLLIFAPSPSQTSTIIWWLRDFLRPIPLAGDFRPYFHIHDQDYTRLVNKNPPKAGLILGDEPATLDSKTQTLPQSTPFMGPPPGFHSKHRRFISKDRALLKRLEEALLKGGAAASLKTHGSPLPFRSNSKQKEFYERWLRTPAFGVWLTERVEEVQAVLKTRAGGS